MIVFIPGGTFVVGSCEAQMYGPQVLLDRDVVLVGVNYRLGPLGWLSLETDEAPGNLGLHDQHLALLWVQRNISRFGGDPENVTLMGVSAGAMSIMCHLVSPFNVNNNLFHKIIALSGRNSFCSLVFCSSFSFLWLLDNQKKSSKQNFQRRLMIALSMKQACILVTR